MNTEILNMLGICKKSGNLVWGTANVCELIKSHKAKAVVIASDISAKTEKELRFLAGEGVKVIRIDAATADTAHATATTCGIFATADKNFAEQFIIKGGIC